MPNGDLEFSSYSCKYSRDYKDQRKSLELSLQAAVMAIEDGLAENPESYQARSYALPFTEDIFVFKQHQPEIHLTYRVDKQNQIVYFLHLAAPTLDLRRLLFVSSSKEDEQWLTELKKWLKPLEQRELIEVWDGSEIEPGAERQKALEQALDKAKAAVLLISQNFLFSDEVANQQLTPLLEKAAAGGVKILWIAVSESTVRDSEIFRYESVHLEPPLDQLDVPNRNKEFHRIYEKLREVVEAAG